MRPLRTKCGGGGIEWWWLTEEGWREGYSTSSILLNVYHQAVMKQVVTLNQKGEGGEVGMKFRWIPRSSFTGGKN